MSCGIKHTWLLKAVLDTWEESANAFTWVLKSERDLTHTGRSGILPWALPYPQSARTWVPGHSAVMDTCHMWEVQCLGSPASLPATPSIEPMWASCQSQHPGMLSPTSGG